VGGGLVICLKTQKEYTKCIKWLETWESKIHLNINEDKTKEMRLGRLKKQYHKFEIVTCYKYLGVNVYDSCLIKKAKQRINEIVKSDLRLPGNLLNAGICRLGIYWWMISKVIYHAVSEVQISSIKAEYVEAISLKTIRKITNTARFVSTKMLKEFYAIEISYVLNRMADKISKNIGISGCIRNKMSNSQQKIWINSIKSSNLTLNQFAMCIKGYLWKKKNMLRCSICKEALSILHICEHYGLPKLVSQFIIMTRSMGIYKAIENLSINTDSMKFILSKLNFIIQIRNEYELS